MAYPPASFDLSISNQPDPPAPEATDLSGLAALLTPEETSYLTALPPEAWQADDLWDNPVFQGIASKAQSHLQAPPTPVAPPAPADPRVPSGGALDAVRALQLNQPETWATPVPSHGPLDQRPSVIRAPTWSERLTGAEHDLYAGLAQTLPGQFADALMVSGFAGKADELEHPNTGVTMSTTPPPGEGLLAEGGPGLFSRVDAFVRKLPEQALHPSKWAALLRSNAGAEELAARSIPEFLASKGHAAVTPAEMASHLQAHPAPLPTRTTLGATPPSAVVSYLQGRQWPIPSTPEGWQTIVEALTGEAQRLQRRYGPGPESQRLFTLAEDATMHAEGLDLGTGSTAGQPKYARYQLPGGTDYRENLFQLPEKPAAPVEAVTYPVTQQTPRRAQIELPEGGIVDLSHLPQGWVVGGVPGQFATFEDAVAAGQRRAAEVIRLREPAVPTGYTSSHFKEHPNLVVHTRSNNRTLPTGEPGHFIEEIQSDWHQQGKKRGYAQPPTPEQQRRLAYLKEQLPQAEQWMHDASEEAGAAQGRYLDALRKETHARIDPAYRHVTSMDKALKAGPDATREWRVARGLALESGALGALKDAELLADRQLQERIATVNTLQQEKLALERPAGVPDAPFKESWPDLALKQHLLDAAADPEAQWLGFTSGETQAERYDLSKHIDKLTWHEDITSPGHGTLQAYKDGEQVLRKPMAESAVEHEVGKEAAEKLLGQDGTVKKLEGLELKVGGKGMKFFYDQLLPERLRKILKPFGGTVERMPLASRTTQALEAQLDALDARIAAEPQPAARRALRREQDRLLQQRNALIESINDDGVGGGEGWVARLSADMKARLLKEGLPLMAAAPPLALAASHEPEKPKPAADPAVLDALAKQFPNFAATLRSHPPAGAQPPLAALQKASSIGASPADQRTAAARAALEPDYARAAHPQAATLRAPTWSERLTEGARGLYAELARSLPGQATDALGVTGFAGKADELSGAPQGVTASVVAPPGEGLATAVGAEAEAVAAPVVKAVVGETPEAIHHFQRAPAEWINDRLFISTRVPEGPNAPLAVGGPLTTDVAAIAQSPKLTAKIAKRLRADPMLTEAQRAMNDRGVLDAIADIGAQNTDALIAMQPAENVARSRKWYQGAHGLGNEFAEAVSRPGDVVTGDQGAGVIASQSPSKEWHQNVELGKRIMQWWREFRDADTPFSREMFDRTVETTTTTAEKEIVEKHLTGEKADIVRARAAKKIETSRAYIDQPWSKLPEFEQGKMIRAADELRNEQHYPIMSPEGTVAHAFALTKGGDKKKLVWQSYDNIENAVSILNDGSAHNISMRVGKGHKVRSFFNNINVPMDPRSVTADTHNIGGAHFRPMGGKAPEVKGVMQGNAAKPLGIKGAHGVYRDSAVRASAASGDLKLLPNQVQSVSWESIKGLFSSAQRRDPVFVNEVKQIWNEYAHGHATLEEVHARIFDAAGGIADPDWAAK